jgi:hypothetical protein
LVCIKINLKSPRQTEKNTKVIRKKILSIGCCLRSLQEKARAGIAKPENTTARSGSIASVSRAVLSSVVVDALVSCTLITSSDDVAGTVSVSGFDP